MSGIRLPEAKYEKAGACGPGLSKEGNELRVQER
jgi:hypothetical protein